MDPYSSWAMGEFMLALYERLGSGGQKRKPKIAKVRTGLNDKRLRPNVLSALLLGSVGQRSPTSSC